MTIREIVESNNGIDNIDISDLGAFEVGVSAWEKVLDDAYLGHKPWQLTVDDIIALDNGIELEELSY